jgi:hypothetical protein
VNRRDFLKGMLAAASVAAVPASVVAAAPAAAPMTATEVLLKQAALRTQLRSYFRTDLMAYLHHWRGDFDGRLMDVAILSDDEQPTEDETRAALLAFKRALAHPVRSQ